MSWRKKKNHFQLSSSLIPHNNDKSFLDRIVIRYKKWIFCDNHRWPAQWLDSEEAPKHFPKPNLHQKGNGHYLVFCCWSDALQLSESWWNHYIWEACWANWSVQFRSVAQSRPSLCDFMDCSTPGLPVHHQLSKFAQTHVHWVGDAIQPSHPLSSLSPPTFNLSQHQGLFQWSAI